MPVDLLVLSLKMRAVDLLVLSQRYKTENQETLRGQ